MKDIYRTAIAILMNEEDAADALQDTIAGVSILAVSSKHNVYQIAGYNRVIDVDEVTGLIVLTGEFTEARSPETRLRRPCFCPSEKQIQSLS